jgi:hypothetical protein
VIANSRKTMNQRYRLRAIGFSLSLAN